MNQYFTLNAGYQYEYYYCNIQYYYYRNSTLDAEIDIHLSSKYYGILIATQFYSVLLP